MKKSILYALLLGSAALGGCSEQLEADILNFSKNTIQFTAEGGTQTLTVDVKCECTLSCDADWIAYEPQYIEAGRSELTITADENPTFEERETTIMIANEEMNVSNKFIIKQAGIVTYIDCDNELTATYKGGILTTEMQSNIPWKASTDADWLTISPTQGAAGITELSIELPMLSADEKTRQSEIVLFNDEHNITKKIIVKQISEKPFIRCSHDRITAEFYDTMLPVALETNISYEVSYDADWIRTAFPFGTNGIYINRWFEAGSRQAEVIVSNAKYNITKKIIIEQNGLSDNRQIITYTTSDKNAISLDTGAYGNVFGTTLYAHHYNAETQTGILIFPQPATLIGERAFYNCSNLASITISNSVTSIGNYAFQYCSSLTSITIPDSVTEIGVQAFYSCSSLTSITIPDSVTEIGVQAFYSCSSLTSVTIGNGATSIGERAFDYCRSLTSVTIGNGATSIGERAFYGCSSLTSVTIGNSVTSIGNYAFSGCSSLTNIYCKPTVPPSTGGYTPFPSCVQNIYVPRASVEAYKNAAYWKEYASIIVGYDF
ncbi:MAG: leucine-rich repeat protein [Alistipes sp.]|nr:leucine-rich repeat protein [Alistipes sp.]